METSFFDELQNEAIHSSLIETGDDNVHTVTTEGKILFIIYYS